ncbi:MAG: hypothetical protein IPG06_06910 [Haliea sp.]|nr:hypothetical protein [Haliea sp.]
MLIILIVSAGLLFITFYPGAMSIDSYEQLRQARSGQFGDWHPPFMAWGGEHSMRFYKDHSDASRTTRSVSILTGGPSRGWRYRDLTPFVLAL